MDDAVFRACGLTVTPERVLSIRRVIMIEAAELTAALGEFKRKFPDGMPILGGDPVSPYAAAGFTEATNAYLAQCRERIDRLNDLGARLAEAAREYGLAEADIEASFRKGMRRDSLPPPLVGGALDAHAGPARAGWSG